MENIKERRIGFEQLGNIYAKAASVKTEQVFINGVNCYWLTPENPAANKVERISSCMGYPYHLPARG